MTRTSWREKRDPLYRGDAADAVTAPTPAADPSIVRHILYLGGFGRETPYSSTTEDRATAEEFGRHGRVWKTKVSSATSSGVGHISRIDLLSLLSGKGKGKARWSDSYEVLQAKRYVEQHAEHLLDFRSLSQTQVRAIVDALFERA